MKRTPATAVPPRSFQQAGLCPSLPTSPAPLGATDSTPQPTGAESLLEEDACLSDSDSLSDGSVSAPKAPALRAGIPSIQLVSLSAVTCVRVWQKQNEKKLWGGGGDPNRLPPRLAQLADILCTLEAKQSFSLSHCPPRYCQFLHLRECWYRVLWEQAVQLQQHVTADVMAPAATQMAVEWIQEVQETLGTLLPADSVAYSSQQADAHCPLLPPHPTLSPAGTDPASQAATASRHDNPTTGAEGASADQQQSSEDPVKQEAGYGPQPSAKGYRVHSGFCRIPLSGIGMRLKRWQHRSEAPDCGCDSCVAWQTGTQLLRPRQAMDCRPYRSFPVRAHHLPTCLAVGCEPCQGQPIGPQCTVWPLPPMRLLYTNTLDAGTLLLLASVAPGSVLKSFRTCRDFSCA